MNSKEQNNIPDQELDLGVISEKLKSISKDFKQSIFNFIQFIIKKIVIIGILLFIGIGLGVYLDKVIKTYNNEVIVVPNFGSYDYLYSKIEFLESKIKDKDTLFLKKIGIKDPESFRKIEIEPILDVYQFVSATPDKNFELLKLMAEDGDMNKIVKDELTSKNYTYHLLKFVTDKRSSDQEFLLPLMNYLNQDIYFNQLKKVYNQNIHNKIKADEVIITQIDGFLNAFSSELNQGNKNDKLVYYNENTQLNYVIQTKNNLITEVGKLRTDLISLDHVIKKVSHTSNIKNTETVNGKMKFILPIVLVLLYMFIHVLIGFYKSQAQQKIQQQ
jgi:hypothetical protein